MLGSVSFSGLGSGLPSDMVDQLVAAQRVQLNNMTARKSTYESQKTAFSGFESKLSALNAALSSVKGLSETPPMKITNSDDSSVGLTASSSAASGNYNISVDRLATYDRVVKSGIPSPNSQIRNSAPPSPWTFTINGVSFSGNGQNWTVQNLVDNINANPAIGVRAELIDDGGSYSMAMTALEAGADKISIQYTPWTVFEDYDNASTGYSGTGIGPAFTQTDVGQTAQITVDGQVSTSTSNTFDNVIAGATIVAKKLSPGVDVTLERDEKTVITEMEDFVKAYNDVIDFVSSKKETSFAGESAVRGILSRIRADLGQRYSGAASGSVTALAEVGLTTNYKTGRITFDSSRFETALGDDFAGVSAMLAGTAGNQGVMVRLENTLDSLTDSYNGVIAGKQSALDKRIDSLETRIEREESRLEKVRDMLTLQFANLDSLVNSLNSAGQSITSLLNNRK